VTGASAPSYLFSPRSARNGSETTQADAPTSLTWGEMTDHSHFDPTSYLEMVRADVPDFDTLQSQVAQATVGLDIHSVLDLGTGTGGTAAALLDVHPSARLIGVDESEPMLTQARALLPDATLLVRRLEDPLPVGPFDVVASVLAIHHLDEPAKADLFRRVAAALRDGGRFVFGDVVIPGRPEDAVSPIHDPFDQPSSLADQLEWLTAAGLQPSVLRTSKDLAVVAADRAPDS
jgi:tRNA (cmo5U34)-methyltransferase